MSHLDFPLEGDGDLEEGGGDALSVVEERVEVAGHPLDDDHDAPGDGAGAEEQHHVCVERGARDGDLLAEAAQLLAVPDLLLGDLDGDLDALDLGPVHVAKGAAAEPVRAGVEMDVLRVDFGGTGQDLVHLGS